MLASSSGKVWGSTGRGRGGVRRRCASCIKMTSPDSNQNITWSRDAAGRVSNRALLGGQGQGRTGLPGRRDGRWGKPGRFYPQDPGEPKAWLRGGDKGRGAQLGGRP